jgi:hypothetical protein
MKEDFSDEEICWKREQDPIRKKTAAPSITTDISYLALKRRTADLMS